MWTKAVISSVKIFFVVAGFVASSTQWLAFICDWSAALLARPRIAYFRYNEAMGMKGQFDSNKGWDDKSQDKRIEILTDVVKKCSMQNCSSMPARKASGRWIWLDTQKVCD
jgi:hypothetical protein